MRISQELKRILSIFIEWQKILEQMKKKKSLTTRVTIIIYQTIYQKRKNSYNIENKRFENQSMQDWSFSKL